MKQLKNLEKLHIKARKSIQSGNFFAAIEIFDQLLVKSPKNTAYLMGLGEALLRAEKYDEALPTYAMVVEQEPRNVDALSNFSVALIRCNRQLEAQKILEFILEIDPNNFAAYINLGNVFQTLKLPEKNLKNAFKAVELNPTSPMALNNLGTALGDLEMNQESREAFLTAVALDANYVPALINLAQVEEKLDNKSDAMVLYENILKTKKLTPSQTEFIKYYLSYSYLYFGRLEEGWRNYELGFGAMLPAESYRSLRRFHQPKWQGQDIRGKRILLWGEQGLGDEILFSTCFHELLELDLDVIVECEPRLVSIFQRAYPSFKVREPMVGPDRFSSSNDFDVHSPFGSLCHLFRNNLENFGAKKPLLSSSTEKFEEFKNRLGAVRDPNKVLVGICWRSGMLSASRNLHYTALVDWKDLLSNANYQFVNLQYGECEEELKAVENDFAISIIRWPDVDLKDNLEGVLALIDNLDCVVSAPTAVCQMAGAMGKKTFLLTRREWPMLGTESAYPWYPSVIPIVGEKGTHLAEKIPKIAALIEKSFR
jgi:tetratricopeptide (TPR) repeat protein